MFRRLGTFVLAIGLASGLASPAHATTITFDDRPVTNLIPAIYPSNQYAGQGVTIQTIILTQSINTVGQIFSLTLSSDNFGVLSNDNSVSPPNFAVATNVFATASSAVLFSFSTPVSSVSLQTDDAPNEIPDVVRLMLLESLGGGNFRVTAVVTGLDNAISAPQNILALTSGAASFAVFATATEAEGFDNLTFQPVPEPGTMLLVGAGVASALARRRLRRA